MRRFTTFVATLGLVVGIGGGFWLYAQDHDHGKGHDEEHEKAGHSHEASQVHGGDVTMTEKHHFEVVFDEGGIRVYPYGKKQEPLAAKGITGKASLQKKGAGKPTEQELKYVAADPKKGIFRDHLAASFDLKGLEKGSAKVTLELASLPDPEEKTTSFTVTFNGLSPHVEYVCPMKCEGGRGLDPAKCPKCKMEMKREGGSEKKGHGDHDHGH